jgi:hypothetical protein
MGPIMKGSIANQKIIIANSLIGTIESEFQFEILDGNKERR